MRKALLTGATGFIGRHVLEPLLVRDFEIHALYHTRPLNESRITWHQADLADEEAVARAIKEVRPTYLLHFAWIATPGVYWTSPENRDWVERTMSLVRTFRENGGKRAVLAGTCAEYDWTHLPDFLAEHAPTRPATPYGQCKNETHERAESFARESGLSLAWGRIFFLFGPHEPKERFVPSVITALLKGQEAKTTSGEQIRDFLVVDDVADAFCALLDSEVKGAVNIASGDSIAVKDIILKIAGIIGRPDLVRLGAFPHRLNEPMQLVADITRLKNEVGWEPRFTLDEGLQKTIEWWKVHTK